MYFMGSLYTGLLFIILPGDDENIIINTNTRAQDSNTPLKQDLLVEALDLSEAFRIQLFKFVVW